MGQMHLHQAAKSKILKRRYKNEMKVTHILQSENRIIYGHVICLSGGFTKTIYDSGNGNFCNKHALASFTETKNLAHVVFRPSIHFLTCFQPHYTDELYDVPR